MNKKYLGHIKMMNYCEVVAFLLIIFWVAGCRAIHNPAINGKIVFQSNRDGNADLYIMNVDGSEIQNLTNLPASDTIANLNYSPVSSPDGKTIAFVSERDGNSEIYVINIESGIQVNLTNNKAWDYNPTWSPDGRYIAFVSGREGNKDNIFIMRSDGSGVHRMITSHASHRYHEITWSPDGSKLAFTADSLHPNGLHYSNGISLLDLSNFQITDLLFDQIIYHYNWPRWSPDGKRILYQKVGTAFTNIYVMNADGTGQMVLSQDPDFIDIVPSWSPDGKYIVFASRRDSSGYFIYVMDADGSDQRRLTNRDRGPGDDNFPIWLPAY